MGQGILQVSLVVAAVLHARFAIYDLLQVGGGGVRPSEAVLAGTLLLGCAGGCIPLVRRHYAATIGPRRAVALVAAAGLLLALLRPPLPSWVCPTVSLHHHLSGAYFTPSKSLPANML